MFRKILRAKIHRATITHADLEYEGSITLPQNLLNASGINEYEEVAVWNVTNGNRLKTYAITNPDPDDTATICMNGAAAHLMQPGDMVIIAAYNYLQNEELKDYKPRLVFVGSDNQIKEQRCEIPGPATSAQL